jgi:hypothetical protein
MLRSIVKNRHVLLASKRSLSHIPSEPSTTTTVILKNLSPLLTESSLKAAIAEIKCRKVEMEPGCSIHLKNEAQANYVSSLVKTKFGYEGHIASTSMPSLLLQNLPTSVCADRLEKAFSSFGPKMIRLIGSSSIQVWTEVVALWHQKLVLSSILFWRFNHKHKWC